MLGLNASEKPFSNSPQEKMPFSLPIICYMIGVQYGAIPGVGTAIAFSILLCGDV